MFDRRTVVVATFLGVLAADPVGTTAAAPQDQASAAKARVTRLKPGPNSQKEVQTALIKAKPGDTIEFGEGTFEFTKGLSLAVEGVTIRGQGMDKTRLSFQKQDAGKEGLLVTRGRFVMEDLTVEDTKGDGVKVNDADRVTFRRVKAQWTGGPKESNGAYGLYPVQCKNVLIEGCVAIGASDAGIYVGQSQTIVVRRCRAEGNVAGIEIENSIDADVYENTATGNAGGILVFDLPGLQVKNGRRVRVFDNRVYANNHANFAPKGNMVANVSPGTGLMVMATDQVEVFRNTLKDNQTTNLAIVSFHITGQKIEDKDKDYDPYPENIYVHDNVFSGGGTNPRGKFGELFAVLLGKPLPDILYDGIAPPAAAGKQLVFLKNNGAATFTDLQWGLMPDLQKAKTEVEAMLQLMSHKTKLKRDAKAYEGELPPLPPVRLPGVTE